MIGVACIGQVDHGKTTLLSAISHLLPGMEPLTFRQSWSSREPQAPAAPDAKPLLDAGLCERERGLTISPQQPHLYRSHGRHYAHYDCPGHWDYTRNAARCMAMCDLAILVISGNDGPGDGTIQHLTMAKAMGIKHLIIFVSQCDQMIFSDPDEESLWFAMFEEEIWSQLPEVYRDAPLLYGDSHAAINDVLEGRTSKSGRRSIEALLAAMAEIPAPLWDPTGPARMWVHRRFSIYGRGTVLSGRLLQGTLRAGDVLEYRRKDWKNGDEHPHEDPLTTAALISLHSAGKAVKEIQAGEQVGVLLKDVKRYDVNVGQLCVAPHQRRPEDLAWRVRMHLTLLGKSGRHTPIHSGYQPQFQAMTAVTNGTIQLDRDALYPGESAIVEVAFLRPIPIPAHRKMLLRDNGGVIGIGEHIELLEAMPNHWLWYQADSQDSLLYLRELLCGPPIQAMWEGIIHWFRGMSTTYREDEDTLAHRRMCVGYVLDHIKGWSSVTGAGASTALTDATSHDPVGLWRRESPPCDDGERGLGHFLEIQALDKRYRSRDVFLSLQEDMVDVMRLVMFARVWKERTPYTTPWKISARLDPQETPWILGWTSRYHTGSHHLFHHEVRWLGPDRLQRVLSVEHPDDTLYGGEHPSTHPVRNPVVRKASTKQIFVRIARLFSGS